MIPYAIVKHLGKKHLISIYHNVFHLNLHQLANLSTQVIKNSFYLFILIKFIKKIN